jgi:transposase
VAIGGLSARVQKVIISLLNILDTIEEEIKELDRIVKDAGKEDERVKLLQTVDGVGPITALAFVAEVDDPKRFEDSKDVAAYVGLTPTQYSSGEIKRQGGISKKGSKHTRCLLVEAATTLLTRCQVWVKLKAWGLKLMRKIGKKKAIIAVARKLAVTMHKMLITGKPFERSTKKKEALQATKGN